jgi:hypothetical protein
MPAQTGLAMSSQRFEKTTIKYTGPRFRQRGVEALEALRDFDLSFVVRTLSRKCVAPSCTFSFAKVTTWVQRWALGEAR